VVVLSESLSQNCNYWHITGLVCSSAALRYVNRLSRCTMAKFDPSQVQDLFTDRQKIETGDHVCKMTPCAKFHPYPSSAVQGQIWAKPPWSWNTWFLDVQWKPQICPLF